MSDKNNAYWLEAAQALSGDPSAEILVSDTETATLLLTSSNLGKAVMKAARSTSAKRANLVFQWEALMHFSAEPDFPGPRPVSHQRLRDGTEVFVFSYLAGRHPAFESDEDFRIFGATLARFHKVSKGKSLPNAPVWDLRRIACHFDNPLLTRLMNDKSKAIANSARDKFGPRFQAQLDKGAYTGLVHSDSHRHNVVIDGARGSLIDFAECGSSALLWDLGVAVADSVVDAVERGEACRHNLVEGYCSIAPEARSIINKTLSVFEAMRCLEVITWPVSDWSSERLVEDEKKAIEIIDVSVHHLEALLALA